MKPVSGVLLARLECARLLNIEVMVRAALLRISLDRRFK